jgi:chemotaxis protein methyltransferase CheR
MVTFAYLNLAEDAYPSLATNTNAMDLILCRNVAIYLPEAVTRQIARRFHRCLLPESWLIVGATETSGEIYGQFAAHSFPGAVIYRKEDTETRRPGDKETRRERDTVVSPLPRVTVSPRPSLTPSPRLPVTASPRLPISPPPPPADAYQEGLALLEQGRYEEAISRFRDCIARNPGCVRAYYQMARVHANQGRLEEARSWCQQAIERDPLLSEAHYTLALIHQEEGALVEAIARLKKTLYLDPNFVLAHFSLANLYGQVARPEQAVRHRMQAIRLATKMPPDDVVPGSDGLTVARLLTMVKATI